MRNWCAEEGGEAGRKDEDGRPRLCGLEMEFERGGRDVVRHSRASSDAVSAIGVAPTRQC